MHPGDPIDDPDFISRMRTALPRPPEPPVAGAPPTYHDMEHAVKKGSPATSFDDLPRPLASALPGFGLRVLVGVLEAQASGIPSRLLSGPPPLPGQEAPGVGGAQQPARHAGALPPAAGDGRRAGWPNR